MSRKILNSPRLPNPIGPYSHAVSFEKLLFVSGQIPIDPKNGKVIRESFSEQCHRVILNLKTILEECSSSLNNVIKITIFMKNLNQINELNEIYSEYFNDSKPARTCVEVSNLPKDVDLEIDAIAEIY